MNAGQYFALVRDMPVVHWPEVTGGRSFVVLSPHPDDESLGSGGLIALARRDHQDVAIVLLTDGSGSHPRSITYPRERLIALRRAEIEQAGRILGVAPNCVTHLGLPDTAAPRCGPVFDRAAAAVSKIVDMTRAESLFVTWRHDPHCDHEAAAILAEDVRRRHPSIRLWAYPVWGWHLAATADVTAPPPHGCRVDITEVTAIKRAAIDAHVSQMTDLIADDPEGFRLHEETLAPFLGRYEYFIEVPI
jgi:LmbE family N-acetylglucosaminyl deacetylase